MAKDTMLDKVMREQGFDATDICYRSEWDENTAIVIIDLVAADSWIDRKPHDAYAPVYGLAIDATTEEVLDIEWFDSADTAAQFYNALYTLETL